VFSPGLVHDARAQSFSSGPTAPAGPADLFLAAVTEAGIVGDRASSVIAMSADARKVALASLATNFDPRDTDHNTDVYVKDLTTGDLTLASTSDTGVKGNNHSGLTSFGPAASFSADGTRLAFLSHATNLDPGDTEGLPDAYVKDLTTGDLMLASTTSTGIKGNGGVNSGPSLSADGTKLTFATDSTNLDPGDADNTIDVYVKNLTTGALVLADTSATGVKSNGGGWDAWLSADGTKVGFGSRATNLVAADTDTLRDVYVKDLTSGDITLASTSDAEVKANDDALELSLSADGTRVAFFSRATNLDPLDTDSLSDVYVKDLATGEIALASTSDSRSKGNNTSLHVALSASGTRVAFLSRATNLDPADTDTLRDVYVKDLTSGDITLASTSDTGVKGNADSSDGPLLSADATKAAFFSQSTNLNARGALVKVLPSVPTSIGIDHCSNGQTGVVSMVELRSYGARPLGCPVSLDGDIGNDYADTTPILVGAALSMKVDWATGPDSYGVGAAKAGPTGTQWRFRLAITASPGHDTPATNQYLPAAGSGFTKTRLQGKFDISALDSFDCTTGVDDPLSWLSLANNGTWVAKTS
jgi:Tol biopolymer transport system component